MIREDGAGLLEREKKARQEWQEAVNYLAERDSVLGKYIAQVGDTFPYVLQNSSFESLLRSIVGQQISVSAAASVWKKLKACCELTPEVICNRRVEDFRQAGLSGAKAGYVVNIARHFLEHDICDKTHWERPFEEISKELCSIKGVGRWTGEMFGMFYLLEPDIFPAKDLGVIRAIERLYEVGPGEREKLSVLTERWRPFRTHACWYLWHYTDVGIDGSSV